jgi:RimJ/RimL family protein N-acetyltransferase
MDYQIVPISENEIPGFCAAVDSVARERQFLSFLEGPPLAMSEAFVQENLREGHPHVVALYQGEVVGWCDITSLHRPIYTHVGELGIGVVARYRGLGIGKALMREALGKAKAKSLTRIELTVFAQNKTAIALYEHFGFTVEGLMRNRVKIDEGYQDVFLMALLFP